MAEIIFGESVKKKQSFQTAFVKYGSFLQASATFFKKGSPEQRSGELFVILSAHLPQGL